MSVALNTASRALPKARRRHRGPMLTQSEPAPASVAENATQAPITTVWAGWDDEASPTHGLTNSELAGLLVSAAVGGRRVLPIPHTLEGLCFTLWRDLWKADPDAARLAFSTAVIDRAPVPVVTDVAELIVGLSSITRIGDTTP